MENPHPISIAALVTGLMTDIRCLLQQEVRLARHEMQYERQKLIAMVVRGGTGLILGILGGLFILLMLVHALHTAAGLPLWASYGTVGVISALAAGGLLYSMAKLGTSIRLWPFRTFHSLKEDVRWIKEQVLSSRT